MYAYYKSELKSDTLGDCSDILLQNLKELKISRFSNSEVEINFVKLILAKSPVLKKVIIEVEFDDDDDRKLEILRTFLQSPHASPYAEIIVMCRRFESWDDKLCYRIHGNLLRWSSTC